MASKFCCTGAHRSDSPTNPDGRHLVVSDTTPFLQAPSPDSTISSLPSPTVSRTDFRELQLLYGSEINLHVDVANSTSGLASDLSPAAASKTPPYQIRARISKKLSRDSASPKKCTHQTSPRTKEQHAERDKTTSKGTKHSDVPANGIGSQRSYDSDARVLSDSSMMKKILRTITPMSSKSSKSPLKEETPPPKRESVARLSPSSCERKTLTPSRDTCPVPSHLKRQSMLSALNTQADSITTEAIDSSSNGIDLHWERSATSSVTDDAQESLLPILHHHDRLPIEDRSADTLSLNSHITPLAIDDTEIEAPAECKSSSDLNTKSSSPIASIHLYDMRISQHLRSLSSMSTASSMSAPNVWHQVFSDLGDKSQGHVPNTQQVSIGSGFTSDSVPSTWGNVIRPAAVIAVARASLDGESGPPEGTKSAKSSRFQEGLGVNAQPRPRNARSSNEAAVPSAKLATHRPSLLTMKMFSRKAVDTCDGSSDNHLAPTPGQSSRRRSTVSSNHEEAAAVWEKALRDHQERQLAPPRTRGLSVTSTSGLSPSIFGRPSISSNASGSDEPTIATRKARSMSQLLEFRPINTQHSFDHLLVPTKSSVSQPASPDITITDTSLNVSEGSAHPVSSVEGLLEVDPLSIDRSSNSLLVPGHRQAAELQRPNGIAWNPKFFGQRRNSLGTGTGPQSPSALKAWGRFPSHTRAQRNSSAGLQDNVIARDFAPPHPIADEEGPDSTDDEDQKLKRNRKTQARGTMLKNKISTIFKSKSMFFRKVAVGHRTSVSVGGQVEYPELELLPQIDALMPMGSLFQPPPSPTLSTCAVSSGIGSEDFRSRRDTSNPQSEVAGNSLSARGWSHVYSELLGPRHSTTDVSGCEDLDPLSKSSSPGAKSLPATLRIPSRSVSSPRSASTESLRRSTVDLFAMLQENEASERDKALKAAEEAWD